jgi:hypothetical protein
MATPMSATVNAFTQMVREGDISMNRIADRSVIYTVTNHGDDAPLIQTLSSKIHPPL